MKTQRLERINELARKQRTLGLTPEEQKEQAVLRKEYINDFRASMRGILDNTYVQYPDGTKKKIESNKK